MTIKMHEFGILTSWVVAAKNKIKIKESVSMVLESQFGVHNNHVAKTNPNSKVHKLIEMSATKFILFSTFLERTHK
jgi:hypothetical protein